MAALTPQNYRSDFTFVEKFYKLGSSNDLVADKIPDITIDFEFVYRAEQDRSFKAGRRNGEYFNCKPLDDASIEVFIPLSRNPLGTGELFHELKLYTPNDDFPESIQRICIPASTGIILHKGASVPMTTSIVGSAIVAAILAGKSAYEIAVEKYGYEGTEEEYVKAPYRALDLLQTRIGLPSFNAQDYTLTFTAQNGATAVVDLPLETMGLDYDASTKEMIYTRADGTKRRIPLTEFIDIYVGSIGDELQITVEEGNVIRAALLDGSVAWSKLSASLQSKIDNKQDATSNLLNTRHKDIVGAINELNAAIETGSGTSGSDGSTTGISIRQVLPGRNNGYIRVDISLAGGYLPADLGLMIFVRGAVRYRHIMLSKNNRKEHFIKRGWRLPGVQNGWGFESESYGTTPPKYKAYAAATHDWAFPFKTYTISSDRKTATCNTGMTWKTVLEPCFRVKASSINNIPTRFVFGRVRLTRPDNRKVKTFILRDRFGIAVYDKTTKKQLSNIVPVPISITMTNNRFYVNQI
ncbi:hypothetical protein [uncultured Alistipes sp.]|uniref:hypothetical protein n=1 Tax=uncultured Alistipes sp. TaxID=538949 RepID=UPI00272B82DD|nr:hypothetical protein [uncultured Alistipes sp.]